MGYKGILLILFRGNRYMASWWQAKLGAKKYFLLPLIVISLAILVMNSLNFYSRTEIQPSTFAFLEVDGGPATGEYRITFALLNQNGTNGPANGYVILKILGGGQEELYKSELRVSSGDFHEVVSLYGAKLIGFSWIVPVSNVNGSGGGDAGRAEVTFLSLFGNSVTATVEAEVP